MKARKIDSFNLARRLEEHGWRRTAASGSLEAPHANSRLALSQPSPTSWLEPAIVQRRKLIMSLCGATRPSK